jgi:hypothetical protein
MITRLHPFCMHVKWLNNVSKLKLEIVSGT